MVNRIVDKMTEYLLEEGVERLETALGMIYNSRTYTLLNHPD